MFKNFFSNPHYESDATLFLKELHQKNPVLSKNQQEGRYLLWEKGNCYEENKRFKENLKHLAYKYYSL